LGDPGICGLSKKLVTKPTTYVSIVINCAFLNAYSNLGHVTGDLQKIIPVSAQALLECHAKSIPKNGKHGKLRGSGGAPPKLAAKCIYINTIYNATFIMPFMWPGCVWSVLGIIHTDMLQAAGQILKAIGEASQRSDLHLSRAKQKMMTTTDSLWISVACPTSMNQKLRSARLMRGVLLYH
jgi:hypothetical protein